MLTYVFPTTHTLSIPFTPRILPPLQKRQGKSRDDEREGAGLSVTTSGGGGGARNPLFGMNLDNMPGTEGFGGFGDAGESTDDVEEPVPGLGGTDDSL